MAQDMGHANDLLKAIKEFFGAYLPAWLVTPVIAIGLLLFLFKYFGVAQSIGRGWRLLRTKTDRRRALRRARFADHVESQMRRLGEKEEWRDHRYAELEAELEVTGRRGARLFRRTPRNSLKRVSSLSDALEECKDRIVLLEGEPGSGKSVAMRHLTQRMARRAMRRPSESTVIPIYVNLKTFQPAAKPTAEDVRAFVIASINAARDRDIAQFLEEEFDLGMREGGWLFLFDSFDEIPEILSATSANKAIEAYADAVHDFLHGMNNCRGVVASREFRGPGRASWPTFTVVPLSNERRRLLVRNADLPHDVETRLLTDLPHAEVAVQQMSGNPLFLGLLCEHMRQGNDFPTNVHVVLETYIKHRFDRDTELVRGNFGVSSEDVRLVAEELAFLIASRHSLGLDVPKGQAVELLVESLRRPSDHLARALEALVYTKIARTGADDTSVTFSHRRLQEYFATCVVIREPDRVPVHDLLTSGRWRETSVTILQTQVAGRSSRLMEEAVRMLPSELPAVTELGFEWPPGLLHLLGILAEGGVSLPAASALLKKASAEGTLVDRKWALEVCSVADADTCRELLANAFASESDWLRQEAFRQMRRVPLLADGLRNEVRKMLVDLSFAGTLRRQRRAVFAQVRRMPDPKMFERTLRLLLIGPYVHAVVVVIVVLALMQIAWTLEGKWLLLPIPSVFLIALYPVARLLVCRWSILTLRTWSPESLLRGGIYLASLLAMLAIGSVSVIF
ncbi:NACHT domain-containing protein [Lentzea sp. JNUCC 0626]|uniref:NACHT domain-containing protein n=1 Tax=Lentzea sp. JNUCC 0626 TaxID=3367513 RepID=UPI00374A8163